MSKNEIKIRLRLVIVDKDKVLLTYDSVGDYFFYTGGQLEYEESVVEGAVREIKEECGNNVKFHFKKILYIRDFISLKENEHSVELFILGSISSGSSLEKKKDPQFNGTKWLTWRSFNDLPANLYPAKLTDKIVKDHKNNFPSQGEYIGKI
jgi:ADP-ribose pyrophosphatase YjhB (NUDIX family)